MSKTNKDKFIQHIINNELQKLMCLAVRGDNLPERYYEMGNDAIKRINKFVCNLEKVETMPEYKAFLSSERQIIDVSAANNHKR